MTEQQISNRGLEAGQILAAQAYRDAMDALRQSIVAKWKQCSLRDPEGQKLTLQMMKLADTFEGLLPGMWRRASSPTTRWRSTTCAMSPWPSGSCGAFFNRRSPAIPANAAMRRSRLW
jgi:hypothetical protein